jgi:hypothetical protein
VILTPTELELLQAAAEPGGKRIAPNYPPLANLLRANFVVAGPSSTVGPSYYTATAAGREHLESLGQPTPNKVLT